jgi:RND family efflux transporter MFP subunit
MATAQAQTTTEQAVPVVVADVKRRALTETVKVVGTLVAERKVKVAAEISGRVVSVAVDEGEKVGAGQVVVSLFDRDARMRVAAAEAELRTAKQRVGSADADVEIVSADTSLTESQAAEQLRVAQARLEQAKNDVKLTEEKVEGDVALAKANLAASQAKLKLLKAGARPQDIEYAKAQVDGAKTGVTSAELAAQRAQRVAQRKRGLADRGFLPVQDAENAENDYEQAKAGVLYAQTQLRALEQALKLLEAGARPEEIEQTQAEVQAAQESVRAAEKNRGLIAQKKQEVSAAEAEVSRAQKTLDAAKRGGARVRKTQQDVQVVRSSVSLAEANLRMANEELKKTVIRSPISGAVAARHVQPGETVMAGQPLLEIVDHNSLYLEATVSDRDVLKIAVGQRMDIQFEALKGRIFEGLAQEILPPADSTGRNFRVKILLTRKESLLHVGMLATGTIAVEPRSDALTVPVSALLADTPGATEGEVFVVENNTARKRQVILGARIGEIVEARGGLSEGEQVVIEGQPMLKDGRRVRAQ